MKRLQLEPAQLIWSSIPENATGHYSLDFSNPCDRFIAQKIHVLNAFETSIIGSHHAVKLSQFGDGSLVRNVTIDGARLKEVYNDTWSRRFSTEWSLPQRGHLVFDYASSLRPGLETQCIPQHVWDKMIDFLKAASVSPPQAVQVLRAVSGKFAVDSDKVVDFMVALPDIAEAHLAASEQPHSIKFIRGRAASQEPYDKASTKSSTTAATRDHDELPSMLSQELPTESSLQFSDAADEEVPLREAIVSAPFVPTPSWHSEKAADSMGLPGTSIEAAVHSTKIEAFIMLFGRCVEQWQMVGPDVLTSQEVGFYPSDHIAIRRRLGWARAWDSIRYGTEMADFGTQSANEKRPPSMTIKEGGKKKKGVRIKEVGREDKARKGMADVPNSTERISMDLSVYEERLAAMFLLRIYVTEHGKAEHDEVSDVFPRSEYQTMSDLAGHAKAAKTTEKTFPITKILPKWLEDDTDGKFESIPYEGIWHTLYAAVPKPKIPGLDLGGPPQKKKVAQWKTRVKLCEQMFSWLLPKDAAELLK